MLPVMVAALVAFQCPDGSPPPCRSTSSVGGRVPTLALNDNTWLVLPFENSTRAADAEVIRQASVSQLYAELTRWQGVRMISDDRIADLIQQLPAAQRDRIGLEAATTLARRVGAGRIVLGNYLAAGGRANVTAKVYDTRTGRELRVVRDVMAGFASSAALDSLGASFARLASGVLDVPAGSGGASSGMGTSSMTAYRAYVAAMDAVNRVDIDSALASLDRALQLDSNYAMAHFQRWRFSTDTASGRRHREAALRLSGNLPSRARALVEATVAAERGDFTRLCSASAQIVAADSSDADGWVLVSACYLDRSVYLDNGQPRMRGSMTQAIRAAERAYALAPTSVTTSQGMLQALGAGSFMACTGSGTGSCPRDQYYRVSLVPSGDTIVALIRLWSDVRARPPDLEPAAIEAAIQRYRRARAVCERLAAISDTRIVHQAAAQLAFAIGDAASAEAHRNRGTMGRLDSIRGNLIQRLQNGLDVGLALERPAQFQAYADTLTDRNGLSGPYRSMLGHLAEGADSTPAQRQSARWRQILVGVLPDSFDVLDQQMQARLTGAQRDDYVLLTTMAAFHLSWRGPALDTAADHPLRRYQAFFARRDTARARTQLAEFDTSLLPRHLNTPDDGGWLLSAESHLELGDSAVAFQRMQEFGRRWPAGILGAYILEMRQFQSTTPRLWGRSWLLYGDLAMARGQRAEARRAYRMVVGLWERGDPVVQPFVTRARAALQTLE